MPRYRVTETTTRTTERRFYVDEDDAQDFAYCPPADPDVAYTVEECPHDNGSGHYLYDDQHHRGCNVMVMTCEDCGDEMYRELRHWSYTTREARWYGSPDQRIMDEYVERIYPDDTGDYEMSEHVDHI